MEFSFWRRVVAAGDTRYSGLENSRKCLSFLVLCPFEAPCEYLALAWHEAPASYPRTGCPKNSEGYL